MCGLRQMAPTPACLWLPTGTLLSEVENWKLIPMMLRTVEEIDAAIAKQLVRRDIVIRYKNPKSIATEQAILDALLEERSATVKESSHV